jgi:hypothetical protein
MRWVYINRLAGDSIDPAMVGTTATNQKRMGACAVDHCELKIAIERGNRNRLPRGLAHWNTPLIKPLTLKASPGQSR